MLPILGFPDVVGEFAGFFRRVFSWNQFRRFKQYLSGLIAGGKATVCRIASRLVDRVDQSSLNRFLTLYEWDEERVNRRRLEMLQSMKEMRWRREGVIAIDETLLPKAGKKMPGAGRLWNPNSGSYVHAQCLVTSHYIDQQRDYPVGSRQYFKHGSREASEKGFRSKVDLAMDLVDECERLGVAAENYVFDAWFLSKRLARHIEAHGKGWVSRLKANRIVYYKGAEDGHQGVRGGLAQRILFKEIRVMDKSRWMFSRVLDVNRLGRVRVVICYDNGDLKGEHVYLATNRLYWEERRVVLSYCLRFRIDTFYKDAKQNLGFGGCQLRSRKAPRGTGCLGSRRTASSRSGYAGADFIGGFSATRPSERSAGRPSWTSSRTSSNGSTRCRQNTSRKNTKRHPNMTQIPQKLSNNLKSESADRSAKT